LDGNSIVFYYKFGKLEHVVTRGEDNVGIIRTAKFLKMPGVKTFIPELRSFEYISVRGEAVILKAKYVEKNGFDTTKSSRNAVGGAIARQTAWETVFKHLEFSAYTFTDCITGADLCDKPFWSNYFKVESQVPFTTQTIEDLLTIKKSCEYDCDGIVFKNPDGEMFALKFEDEYKDTELISISNEIGQNQRITPVANLKPIQLAGATITRASLGSYQLAIDLGIWPQKKNTIVRVIRANEIIPYVTKMVSSEEPVVVSRVLCPSCGTDCKLIGAHMFCVNPDCPNIENQFLHKFVSFLAPEGLKEKTLEKIFEANNICTIEEYLETPISEISFGIDGIGGHAQTLFTQMKMVKEIPTTVLYQTFFNGCGERASKAIVKSGFLLSTYLDGDRSQISKLYSIPNFNSGIISEFPKYLDRLEDICDLITVFEPAIHTGTKTFCATGVRVKGDLLEKSKKLGWEEKSGVSEGLDVLIVKDTESTSSKMTKAKAMAKPPKIVSLEEFEKILNSDE
jgi:DNA ligase (NAD+)